MASRCSSIRLALPAALVCGALLAAHSTGSGQAPQGSTAQDRSRTAQRANERIRTLLREADSLAAQQSKLLTELRGLDEDRQKKAAEVARIDRELAETQAKLTESTKRAEMLRQTAEAQRPDIEARLVQLYKQGRAGYWRMLLAIDDLRSLGRAYRNAAALTAIDRERVETHQQTLQSLDTETKQLTTRAAQLANLQNEAKRARIAADRAVAAHSALIDSIDARRDLNAQMTGELQAAQQRLQASLSQADAGGEAVTLPLEAFHGALPWPVRGRVAARFGREASSRFGTAVVRNGIEIETAEGQRVTAVHEGTVAYADQFTGYGTLVIVEHGGGGFTLYGYLGSAQVQRGSRVEQGSVVGISGRSPAGNPTVYFELRIDGRPVDPLQWLQKGNP
jgi:septal ring factor EnvC (AmiA/AmiB activator)